jgi:hypothetical protein
VSRITLESHYRRRSLLVLLWNEAPRIYGLLSPAHQWELHRFYQPDRMVDFDEFALHIAALKRTEPSLVNRVGKHFAKLESFYLASGTELSKLRGGQYPLARTKRRVVAAGIVRPEPNLRMLARALLATAEAKRREVDQKRDAV